jgi:hypothetical protein
MQAENHPINTSPYELIKTDNSFCPLCKKTVSLLCPIDIMPNHLPAFYICFRCKQIGQVGVGQVPKQSLKGEPA